MKLSYLTKTSTPLWMRIIDPLPPSDTAEESYPGCDPEIRSIHANASEVRPGGLFIAIKGFKRDGHDYIGQAIANGAVAIVTERRIDKKTLSDLSLCNGEPYMPAVVEVKDSRKAMSAIAARFYGDPSASMVMTGITGTNGKTTTSFLIESILKAAGYETGVIGTVNFRYGNKIFDAPVTTPESIDLQRILGQMRESGVTHVVMEVSSHAIDLHRVRDCAFDVGVFTNLTQDHLDYHKSISSYFACKKRFFTKQLKRGKKGEDSVVVINVNDSYGALILQDSTCKMSIATGFDTAAINATAAVKTVDTTNRERSYRETFNTHFPNISCKDIRDDIAGLSATLQIRSEVSAQTEEENLNLSDATDQRESGIHTQQEITIPFKSGLAGLFNLENILCATGAAHALGISPEIIRKGIESCHGVPGRLERVNNSGERYIFVDYAHTPDALESTLKTLKLRAPGRLISVFGCGGDRDRAKRPIMGAIAYRYSDIAIVTSDNPRSEEPDAIISQIVEGIKEVKMVEDGAKEVVVEPDRARALEHAVRISTPGDIIVAAGKGHERYQITAQGKIDFDDRVILRDALIKYGFSEEI